MVTLMIHCGVVQVSDGALVMVTLMIYSGVVQCK